MVTALPAPAGTGRKVPEGRKAQLELSKHRELSPLYHRSGSLVQAEENQPR